MPHAASGTALPDRPWPKLILACRYGPRVRMGHLRRGADQGVPPQHFRPGRLLGPLC